MDRSEPNQSLLTGTQYVSISWRPTTRVHRPLPKRSAGGSSRHDLLSIGALSGGIAFLVPQCSLKYTCFLRGDYKV